MVQGIHRIDLLSRLASNYGRGYSSESGSAAGAVVILAVVFGLYVLLGLGFGFGGRAIMRSKGRSGGAGFALGFFLGVIGLLIAAVMSPTPEHEAERFRQQMLILGGTPGAVMPQSSARDAAFTASTSGGAVRPSSSGRNLLALAAGGIALSTVMQFATAWINSYTGWRILSWLSCVVGIAAAAACLAVVAGRMNTEPKEQLPSWWQPTVITAGSLAGLFALLRPATSRYHGTVVIFAQPLVFIAGTAVAVLALVRSQRTGARISAAWVGIVLVRTVASKIHFIPYFKYRFEQLALFPRYWGHSGVWTILALLASLALGGLAVWVGFIRPAGTGAAAVVGASPAPQPTAYQSPGMGQAPLFPAARPVVNLAGAQTSPTGGIVPGWAADPFGRNEYRYWDGATWTDQVANGGVVRTDPATATALQLDNDPTAQVERPGQPSVTDTSPITDRWGPIDSDKTVVVGARRSPLELVFDNGLRTSVSSPVIVGRQPGPVPAHPDAEVFKYDDPSRMVSKSHFVVGRDEVGAWVEDLASANGTIVVDSSGSERVLEPHQRTRVDVGVTVRFADQWVRINQGF